MSNELLRDFEVIALDRVTRRVIFPSGASIDLTNREFFMLDYLMEHADRPVSRLELLRVFGMAQATSNAVDVYISYLRTKLGEHWIGTVRGKGYRFQVPTMAMQVGA